MEETQEDHEKSLEESQEKSQGAVEEREIPCYTIPSMRLAEPTEEPAEKIADGSQKFWCEQCTTIDRPIASVEIRQETDETFQQGLLEEIQTPRGIAGCLIGGLASVAAIFGVYRGTSNITPLGTGKSLSEAFIFASTNPQYDEILFVELPLQYMKIPRLGHWENMMCT